MNRFTTVLSLLVFMYSCKPIQPLAPSIPTTDVPPIVQPPSQVDIPIVAELKPYFGQAEASVPTEINGGDNPCQGLRYAYHFQRSPLDISGSGNVLKLSVLGSYWAQGSYCATCVFGNCVTPKIGFSCGNGSEPMRQLLISYQSSVSIQPSYQIQSTTTLTQLDAVNRCIVTVANIDVTDRLLGPVRNLLQNFGGQIDQRISGINFKESVRPLWKSMFEEIPITPLGYLHINPKGLRVSKIDLAGSVLNLSVGLSAMPLITSASTITPPDPLPDLDPTLPGNGFSVYLDLDLKFDSLSTLLNHQVAGKLIPIGKNKIIVSKAKIYGLGNSKIVVQLGFKGSRRGTLYLIGTPTYDGISHLLSIPDLTFDIHTKDIVLKLAKWLLNAKITDALRAAAKYDLTSTVSKTKSTLETSLNKKVADNIQLSGIVDNLNLEGLYPTVSTLIIRAFANGSLQINISK